MQNSQEDETIIFQNFVSGDDSAFKIIYYKYVDLLLSYGVGLGFGKMMLKDAIQDVFVKLYLNRQHLRDVKNFKSYLFSSLRNRLLDVLRASSSCVNINDIENHKFNFLIKTSILDELIKEEDKMTVQNKIDYLLHKLTSRQQHAIYLRFMHEMEYEDIASLLNITTHASRKLISRAIKKIREEETE